MSAIGPSSLYEIREVRLEDVPELVDLINDAYWREQKPFFDENNLLSRLRINAIELKKIIESSDKRAFVLADKINSVVIGIIVLELPENQDSAKFGLFAVRNDYSGEGLGKPLIEKIEEEARSAGRVKIKIEVFVFAENLAAYYEKFGYSFNGKINIFNHDHDACIRPEYQVASKRYLKEMEKFL